MSRGQGALEVGLRVLAAITQWRDPDPTDIAELRRFAPELTDRPVDEVARIVVRKAADELVARRDGTSHS